MGTLQAMQSCGSVVGPRVGKSWAPVLDPEFEEEYFKQLSNFVAEQRKQYIIYPPSDSVFAWTRACTMQEVKVIIVGQNPYHNPNQAHGLAFSVPPGVQPPQSLKNIYKELVTDIEGFETPEHGCLMGWAKQGVLLLNSQLTVQHGHSLSHKNKGWETFTDFVISYFNNNTQGIVFILWGNHAQKKGAQIDQTKHCVTKGAHPSPLSCYRGFYGSRPFSKCNEYLVAQDKCPIDWCDLPKEI